MAKPKIRFNGYTEDWEQRKLGELVGIYDGVHQTPDYQDSGIMFLSVENIVTLKSEKYIAEEAFERDYKVYPEKGDILMTRIGDVGTTNVVETAEKVAFYVSLALLKPNGIDSYFLSNAMKTNAFQKGLRERTLVTAIPQKINKDEIGKIDIFITNNDEEQKKIGAYFSNLDHLITLHQRKCEQTKTLKKYMLQKMFPQDGEKVPQIRFEGFTEDWEQRKLGEVIEGVSKKNANGLYTQDDILACSLGTELDRKTIFYGLRSTEDSVKSYRIVNIGNVIYTKSPIKGYPNGIVRTCKIVDGIVPSLYCVYKKKENISIPIDTRFIQSYLEDKGRLDQYLCPLVNVGARNNVNITDKEFLEGIIKIPTTVEEQAKIVDVLEKINHLITLHQRKCDELKEVKKFMLQNMFV